MLTNVYIDGFNLFNGCLRQTPYKWLNIEELCVRLFPNDQINRVRYFTAAVIAFPHNADAPTNQSFYLRALRTLPRVTVHSDGWFAAHPVTLPAHPLAYPGGPQRPPKLVRVLRMEEKRTDVDLATHLLVDCFENDFEKAVVISNDSDLVSPILMVRHKFGKDVVAVNPHRAWKMSKQLVQATTGQVRKINPSLLRACQFPAALTDAHGRFSKPPSW